MVSDSNTSSRLTKKLERKNLGAVQYPASCSNLASVQKLVVLFCTWHPWQCLYVAECDSIRFTSGTSVCMEKQVPDDTLKACFSDWTFPVDMLILDLGFAHLYSVMADGTVNHLQTKRRLLYLKTQLVPRGKHFILVIKTSQNQQKSLFVLR